MIWIKKNNIIIKNKKKLYEWKKKLNKIKSNQVESHKIKSKANQKIK